MRGFIVGLTADNKREYTINGVKYIVDACFEKTGPSLNYRIGRCITGNVIPLMPAEDGHMMGTENVCSAAGKED